MCRFNGINYEEGEQIQPDCSTLCTCKNGMFQCKTQTCSIDGPTCISSGDLHYHTFDKYYYRFQGDCDYVLTQSCNASEFAVIVTKNAENHSVRIVVPSENLDIVLGRGRGGTVTINGRLQANNGDEITLTSGGVEVVKVGGHPHVILTELGARISWDGLYRVEVTVSTSWRGRLCGLCGNYNGDPNDDFITPNGYREFSANAFGLSWVWNNGTHNTCAGTVAPNPCPDDVMTEGELQCSVLRGYLFSACNNLVNPNTFIESCIYDYCNSDETMRERLYSSNLATYASACARNGVVLTAWRGLYELHLAILLLKCTLALQNLPAVILHRTQHCCHEIYITTK